eukprot:200967-Rhodomonas_salina.1
MGCPFLTSAMPCSQQSAAPAPGVARPPALLRLAGGWAGIKKNGQVVLLSSARAVRCPVLTSRTVLGRETHSRGGKGH